MSFWGGLAQGVAEGLELQRRKEKDELAAKIAKMQEQQLEKEGARKLKIERMQEQLASMLAGGGQQQAPAGPPPTAAPAVPGPMQIPGPQGNGVETFPIGSAPPADAASSPDVLSQIMQAAQGAGFGGGAPAQMTPQAPAGPGPAPAPGGAQQPSQTSVLDRLRSPEVQRFVAGAPPEVQDRYGKILDMLVKAQGEQWETVINPYGQGKLIQRNLRTGQERAIGDTKDRAISTRRAGATNISVGAGGQDRFSPPSKGTIAKQQDRLNDTRHQLAGFGRIMNRFDPKYLTYAGQIQRAVGKQLSKLELADLFGKEWGDWIRKQSGEGAQASAWIADVKTAFNAYRREITGAAAAVQELKSLEEAMFSASDSPEEFVLKMQNAYQRHLDAVEIAAEVLSRGVGLDSPEFEDEFMKRWGAAAVTGGTSAPAAGTASTNVKWKVK